MKESAEWGMVQELMLYMDEFDTDEQKQFIQSLFDNLDPYTPFCDQMEGLAGGENQEKWLYSLYERYCNGDEDAAREIYDE